MSIRSRLELLERTRPIRVSFWDVICGDRALEELDDLGQATLRRLLEPTGERRDTIEERITALAKPAVPPPPTDDGRLSPEGNGDDRDGGHPAGSFPDSGRGRVNGSAAEAVLKRRL